jgi:hypothetical protein
MRAHPAFGFLLALGLAGAGCAYLGPGAPVYGGGAELAALAGVWEGTYEAEDGGRVGRLSFRLAAAADSAYGEVVMLSEPAGGPGGPPGVLVPRAERPRIRFVRVDRGVVAGTLDPYTSPACACEVQTSFQGTISGDEIEGTFVSWRVRGGSVGGGRWHAERVSGGP